MTALAVAPPRYRSSTVLPGAAWNPWASLRARSDVALVMRELPAHTGGAQVTQHSDGRFVVTLDPRLTQVERNERLAHELVHVERGLLPPDAPEWLKRQEEKRVQKEVAERLLTRPALARLAEAAEREGWALEAADILDELGLPYDETGLALLAEVWP